MSFRDPLLSEAKSLLDDITIPFRALVIALLGVVLALLWFNQGPLWMIGFGVVTVLFGRALEWWGIAHLPGKPVAALRRMELWFIAPAMFSAVASALVVIIGIELTVQDAMSSETKAFVTATTAALTAFLTSSFISWAGDSKDSRLADRIQAAFRSHYKRLEAGKPQVPGVRYFAADSAGERWVYSTDFQGISGWGGQARRARAKGLAEELKSGNSDPP